jgi:hypothetical protein
LKNKEDGLVAFKELYAFMRDDPEHFGWIFMAKTIIDEEGRKPQDFP